MASKRKERETRRTNKSARAAAQKQQPSISIVGAGRLGTALALALSSRGYLIEAVVALHASHAHRAAKLIGANTRSLAASQLKQLPRSDLLIITTPDAAIGTVATEIAAVSKSSAAKRTALHASGALSSDVLKPLRAAGFHTGSLHPLVAVSDPAQGALNFQKAFFSIEGDREATRLSRGLVRALGGHAFSINTRHKALYHAAALMAAGQTIALFDIALEMLTRCGLKEKEAGDALLPLTRSALDNLSNLTPARALTGTFARADTVTVHRHLESLRAAGLQDALAAYKLLGLRSLQLARENGAPPDALKEIELALLEREELNEV